MSRQAAHDIDAGGLTVSSAPATMLCFVNAIGSIEMSSKKQVGVDGAGGARKAVSA